MTASSTKQVHIVVYGGQFWGHIRAALLLSVKLLAFSPNLVISFPILDNFHEKVKAAVEATIIGEGHKGDLNDSIRKRFKVEVMPISDSTEVAADVVGPIASVVAHGSGALQQWWTKLHAEPPQDLPLPALAVVDIFTDHKLKSVTPNTPIYSIWSGNLLYFIFHFSPEYKGIGPAFVDALENIKDPVAQGEALEKAWCGASSDEFVVDGVIRLRHYEHFATRMPTPPGGGYMMRTLVTNLLQNVDGVLHTSGSWLEPEAQKAVLRCYDSRLNKKSFFISMLIPATLSQSDGGPAAAQGDASGKDPVISFMDKVLAEHGSNTVIYLSFGSLFAPFTNPWQLDVFIDTLVEHKRHFVISQASLAPIKTPQLEAKLKAAEEAGLAATSDWVPQNAVLEHPALGVFVTHGGWNSFCESVVQTVPLVMWPFQIDQPLTASMMSECKDPAVWQLYETRGPSLPEYRPTYFQDGPRVSPLGEEIPVPTGTPDALKAELERVLIREAAPGSSELKVRKERMVALRHKYLDSVKRGGEQDQAFAQLLQPVGGEVPK